ncbi:MAG: chorismate-binding protein, partial [Smithellaceae bacterium]|nr:chorismate-binding protein [Smithellaceae bacterium]
MANEVVMHDAQTGQWLYFREPRRIISTDRIGEVPALLESVEKAVEEEGLYAAGWISYEASPAFDRALAVRQTTDDFPLTWFGLYPCVEVGTVPKIATPSAGLLNWVPSIDRETYDQSLSRIRDYIAQGDTYQVNYTLRLRSPFTGDPWRLFLELNEAQECGYGAFLDSGRFVICSLSPELFFRREGDEVLTRPI